MDIRSIAANLRACGIVSARQMEQITTELLCNRPDLPSCGCGGGGGSTVQDMQVAWTPTNLKLGELGGIISDISFGSTPCWPGITALTLNQTHIGFIDIETTIDLLTIDAPNLIDITAALGYFAAQNNSVLTSIDLPSLVNANQGLQVSGNPNLTVVNTPNLLPVIGATYNLQNNGLLVASVDQALARCVAQPTWGNAGENLQLNGGTNAHPSSTAPGSDYAILIGRGATVAINP